MKPSGRDELDRHVVEDADAFFATAFRGRGRYETVGTSTLEEARAVAPSLYRDRPVMIYALRDGRQVHVENWPR
jgi:hypothetical protein